MSSVVAIVKSIVGQVIAVSPEGIKRVLIEGDHLLAGERIETGASGAVSLQLADGRVLDVGRDSEWSAANPQISTQVGDGEQVAAARAPSAAELQQAIADGVDPTKAFEAPAAGVTQVTDVGPGGEAGGGHSFVVLDATGETVAPTIGFNTAGIDNANAATTDQSADTTPQRASTLTLSATDSVAETGGIITYTATLTQAATSPLTVTLSNGQSIVIAAGQLTGSVNVTFADANDAYINAHTVSVTVTGTTGGQGLVVTTDTTPANTLVTDTIDPTQVTITAPNGTVAEGSSVTYTISVANAPQTNLVLTLSDGNTVTIPAGQTSVAYTVNVADANHGGRADDIYAQGTTATTLSVTGVANGANGNLESVVTTGATVTTSIVDNNTETQIGFSDHTASVNEGSAATYTVNVPTTTAPLTLTLSYSGTAVPGSATANGTDVTPGDSTVTFSNIVTNAQTGITTATVTVVLPAGQNSFTLGTLTDNLLEGKESLTLTLTGVTGGGLENPTVDGTLSTASTDVIDQTVPTATGTGGNAVSGAGGDSVVGSEDTPVTLTWGNFNVQQAAPGETPDLGVKITSIPNGSLVLTVNGVSTTVAAGDIITKAQLDSGTLVFTPAANAASTGTGAGSTQDLYGAIDFQPVNNATSATPILGSQASIGLVINAVADTPDLNAPATVSGAEDSAIAITGVSTALVDTDGSETLTTTVSGLPANSVITYQNAAGATVTKSVATDGATLDITDANLATLTVTPPLNYNSQVNGDIQLTISSYTTESSNGATSSPNTQTITLVVTPVNDAPTIDAPTTQTTAEDTPLTFSAANGNAITVADVDSGTAPIKVDVTVAGGTLVLADGTTSATNNGVVSLTGTTAQINAALEGATFTPTLNSNSSNGGTAGLTIAVNDQGNTGTGGALTATQAISIDVTPVNDAPTINAPATQTVAEDTPLTFSTANGNAITVADVDSGTSPIKVDVTVAGGTLVLADGTTSTNTNGVVTLTGTPAQINAALEGATFTPTLNSNDTNGTAGLTIAVNDQGNTGAGGALTATQAVAIYVTAVNDAPTIVAPASVTTAEDTPLTFSAANGNAITVADVDSRTAPIKVDVTVAGGTLVLADGTTSTTTNGVVTLTGTPAQINAALEGATFTPTLNSNDTNGTAGLTIAVNDQGNTGAGGALTATQAISIDVTPINDAPTINAPATQTVAEDTPLTFSTSNGNAITVADVDSGTSPIKVDVTVAGGTLVLADGTTSTTTNGVVTLTGTPAQINAALEGATFTPTLNSNDTNGTAGLTIAVNDQGNTGAGGALTATQAISIDVTPVNDAPVANNDIGTTISGSLQGNYYGYQEGTDGPNLGTIKQALDFISSHSSNASFSSTNINYGGSGAAQTFFDNLGTTTNLGKFLGTDSSSLTYANGTTQTTTSDAIVELTGKVTMAAGDYSLRVTADDGYVVYLDGKQVAAVDTNQSSTSNTFNFSIATSGAHDIQIVYWDQGTFAQLTVEVASVTGGVVGAYGVLGQTDAASLSHDTLTTLEDQPLVIKAATLLANDTDVDGDTLTINSLQGNDPKVASTVTDAAGNVVGTVILGANGDVVFTPAKDVNGLITFSYTVTDGQATSNTAIVTVNVVAVNDAPTITAPTSVTTAEDAPLTFSAANGNAITVADVDSSTAPIKVDVTVAGGTLVLADGTTSTTTNDVVSLTGTPAQINAQLEGATFTPTPNANDLTGTAGLTVAVNDQGNTGIGGALTATQTINVDVTPVDDAPVITVANSSVTTAEDTPLVFSQANGNAITVSDVDAGTGTLTITVNVTGGTLQLAGSNQAGTAVVSLTGTLTQINNALEGATFTPSKDFNNVQGGAAGLSIVIDDHGNTGALPAGATSLTGAANIAIDVTPVNDAPVAAASVGAGKEDTGTVTGQLIASDVDLGDKITYSIADADKPAGLTLNATTGQWTLDTSNQAYQHLAEGETEVIKVPFTVTDASGATSTSNLTLTVTGTNDAPVAQAATAIAVEQNTLSSPGVVANATDGSALVITFTTTAANQTVSFNWNFKAVDGLPYNDFAFVQANGQPAALLSNVAAVGAGGTSGNQTFSQTYASPGTYQIVVGVADFGDTVVDATLNVSNITGATLNSVVSNGSITSSNGSYMLTSSGETAQQLVDLVTKLPVTGQLVATDVDDNHTLSFSQTPGSATVAGFSLASSGKWAFDAGNAAYNSLAAGETKTIVIPYTVTDDQGATSTSTLTVTVTGTNDAPIAAASTGTGVEDTTTTGQLQGSDVDNGDTLTYSVKGTDAPAGFAVDGSGKWTLDAGNSAYQSLAAGETKIIEVPFTVTDKSGATSTSILTLTVTGTNDAPVASASVASVNEDQTVTGKLQAVDVDNGDTLTYTVDPAKVPAGFTLDGTTGNWSLNAGNSAYQSLAAGETKTIEVPFTVTDKSGATSTSILTLTVTGTNDAPVASATNAAVLEDSTVTGTLQATDSDKGDVLTYSVKTSDTPAGFTLDASTGQWTLDASNTAYQHLAAGQTTTLTVPFTVTDKAGATSTSNLTVVVTGTNDAPIAKDDSGITVTGLQGNYYGYKQGTDGANLSSIKQAVDFIGTHSADATFSATTLNYGGSSFSNDLGHSGNLSTFLGNDSNSLVYANGSTQTTTSDAIVELAGKLSLAAGTYSLKVTADDGYSIFIDGKQVASYDGDQSSTSRVSTFTVTGTAAHDLQIVYWDQGGYAQLKVEAASVSSTGTVGAYTVLSTTSATLSHDTLSTLEDQPLLIKAATLLANDTDVDDGAQLKITSDLHSSNGTLSLTAAGDVIFTPNANFNGTATFTYTITDGSLTSNTATVTVNVVPVNDAPVATATTATVVEDQTLSGTLQATDADAGDVLTYAVKAADAPAGFTLNSTTGQWTIDASNPAYQSLGAGQSASYTVPFTVTDKAGATSTSTLTLTVTGTNDAPTATSSTITGSEDSAKAIAWSSFGVADVDSSASSLGIVFTALPTNGTVQYLVGTTWTNLTAADLQGGSATKVFTSASSLQFMPATNESSNSNVSSGVGNNLHDYAQLSFQATDGSGAANNGLSAVKTLTVDISAVADAPTVSAAVPSLTSTGLTLKTYVLDSAGKTTFGTGGNGITGTTLTGDINTYAANHAATTTGNVKDFNSTNSAGTSNSVAAGTATEATGLVYLTAGKVYTFSGTADDSFAVTLGGKLAATATWGNHSGAITGSFTPSVSGYYTLDIYHYNQSGPGNYNLQVSVDGATATSLSGSGLITYTSTADAVANGVTLSALNGSNGEGFYTASSVNHGMENTAIKLSAITATFSDNDGSETHTVTLSGLVAGTQIFSGSTPLTANADGTFTVTKADLSNLSLKAPTDFVGTMTVVVTGTSTEISNNSTASNQTSFVVTVDQANFAPVIDLDLNNSSGATNNDYAVAYATPGTAVSIADTDATITDTQGTGTLGGATITLNSATSGDALALGTLPSGITGTVTTSGGSIVVTLSGTASYADYQAAIKAVTYSNNGYDTTSNGEPAAQSTRTISVTVDDGTGALNAKSAAATTTITVAAETFTTQTGGAGTDANGLYAASGANTIMVGDVSGTQLVKGASYNLAFIVDTSGSMGSTVSGTGKSALTLAVEQLTQVFNDLKSSLTGDHAGTVNVFLENFSTKVGTTVSVDLSDANALNTLIQTMKNYSASGRTDYEAAFQSANTWFSTHTTTGVTNLTYFITDGQPNEYLSNGTPVSGSTAAAVNAATDDFATLKSSSTVYAIGLGSSVDGTTLAKFDSDGVVQNNVSASNLGTAIHSSTAAVPAGDDNVSGSTGNDILFGDMVTFTPNSGTMVEGAEALRAYVTSATNSTTSVSDEALHQYITNHISEFNGSIATTAGTLNVSTTGGNDTLLGGDGNDIIFGQGGNDTIQGGAGNDILLPGSGSNTMWGGSGADTFMWLKGDTGSNVIKDFSVTEGDKLDLSDLLQTATVTNIADYIKATTDSTGTTLSINSSGKIATAAADVTIHVDNVSWSNDTIKSLVAGTDPTIKVDHH